MLWRADVVSSIDGRSLIRGSYPLPAVEGWATVQPDSVLRLAVAQALLLPANGLSAHGRPHGEFSLTEVTQWLLRRAHPPASLTPTPMEEAVTVTLPGTLADHVRALGHVANDVLGARGRAELASAGDRVPEWVTTSPLETPPDRQAPVVERLWWTVAGNCAAARNAFGIDHPSRMFGDPARVPLPDPQRHAWNRLFELRAQVIWVGKVANRIHTSLEIHRGRPYMTVQREMSGVEFG
jgi:hypothetical protein